MQPGPKSRLVQAAGIILDSKMAMSIQIQTDSSEVTQAVGRAIGEQAQPGDIYLLIGPMGAGKTCLTQGIAWGVGVEGYPRSPTFVLITKYEGRLTVNHMDLYRIADSNEAWDLGLEEYLFGEGICVVEWAERAEALFPEDAVQIYLNYGDDPNSRVVTIGATADNHRSLLHMLINSFSDKIEVIT